MQTPEDIESEIPDPNDTPYGGLLFIAHGLEAMKDTHADYLNIMLGVTGEYSLAEESQKFIHDITGSEPPEGWDYQIPSEPILNFYYSRRTANTLHDTTGAWRLTWMNYGRGALGNAQTDLKFGTGLAWHQKGINPLYVRPGRLARDMVIPKADSDSSHTGWFFFTGVNAKLVIYDVLLDGTMFRDSPSVDKETWVFQGVTYTGYKWKKWALHYSWIISSPTFEREEGGPDHYGSINVSFKID